MPPLPTHSVQPCLLSVAGSVLKRWKKNSPPPGLPALFRECRRLLGLPIERDYRQLEAPLVASSHRCAQLLLERQTFFGGGKRQDAAGILRQPAEEETGSS